MRSLWVAVFVGVLAWSAIAPKDFVTWCLEVFPAVAGAARQVHRTPASTSSNPVISNSYMPLRSGRSARASKVPSSDL